MVEGDLSTRRKFSCKGNTIDTKLLQNLDQLMLEKCEHSDKSIWVLNQLLCTGATTIHQGSMKSQTPSTIDSDLEDATRMKLERSPNPELHWAS